MTIMMVDVGVVQCIEWERTNINLCSYRLYKNSYTPVHTSTSANFTEVTDLGYAPWTPGFTAASLNGSFQGEIDGPSRVNTFNFSGGAFTVYGYFVTRPSDGATIYAEQASVPFSVTGAGQTFTVTPKKLMATMP